MYNIIYIGVYAYIFSQKRYIKVFALESLNTYKKDQTDPRIEAKHLSRLKIVFFALRLAPFKFS